MNPMVKKILAFGLMGVGGLDLAFGNTNNPVLPAAISNMLTQQVDLALIGAGIVLLLYV
jgi:hypothetical protein